MQDWGSRGDHVKPDGAGMKSKGWTALEFWGNAGGTEINLGTWALLILEGDNEKRKSARETGKGVR